MTRKAWWGVILAAVGVGGATAIIVHEVRASKAAPPAPPAPVQKPVWAPLPPNQDGSFTIPSGSTFAVSILYTNPNAVQLAADMQNAQTAGSVTGTPGSFPAMPGSAPPADWPAADNSGNAGIRWSGAATTNLVLPVPDAQGASVWIVTGFTS